MEPVIIVGMGTNDRRAHDVDLFADVRNGRQGALTIHEEELMKKLIPRKYERRRVLGEARIRPEKAKVPFAAGVLNLAEGGIALFSTRFVERGQLLEIMLPSGGPVAAQDLHIRDGRVAQSRAIPEGNLLFVEFTRPLSDGRTTTGPRPLGTMNNHLTPASNRHARQAARRGFHAP